MADNKAGLFNPENLTQTEEGLPYFAPPDNDLGAVYHDHDERRSNDAIMGEFMGRMAAEEEAEAEPPAPPLPDESETFSDIAKRIFDGVAGLNVEPVGAPFGVLTEQERAGPRTTATATRELAAAPRQDAGPPQAAIEALRASPDLRGAFDQKYGAGSAAKALGE